MDATQFDNLSKTIAARSTRRSALRRVGLGGLAGAAASGGLAGGALAANGDQTCTLTLHAKTASVSAHKDKTYAGALSLTIGSDGAIDNGTFDDGSGNNPTVVGQTNGRAVSFRLDFPNGDRFAFEGTAAQDLSLCRGRIDGIFNGPAETDLGTWTATAGAASGTAGNSTGNASGNASGNAGNGTPVGNASNGAPSGNASNASGGSSSCPASLALCDGVTPCCEAFSPYEATDISCVGGTCKCMYSCAQAGCASNSATTFMTIACNQNPNDLCASMGCT